MKIRTLIAGGLLAICFANPASAQWTGCGIGVTGAMWNGQVSMGGPTDFGTTGERMGGLFNCDYRFQAFVLGAEVSKTWSFGDMNTVGIKDDLGAMGRLGVLITPASLLYAHGDWVRTNVSMGLPTNHIDGWGLGIGNEFRIPNSPIYLDLRYTHMFYDVNNIAPPGVKAESDSFLVALKFKLGPGMFGGGGSIFSNETDPAPPCDPKLAGCKK